MVNATFIWAGVVFTLTIGVLLASVLALILRGWRGGGWLGFALFGWGFLIFGILSLSCLTPGLLRGRRGRMGLLEVESRAQTTRPTAALAAGRFKFTLTVLPAVGTRNAARLLVGPAPSAAFAAAPSAIYRSPPDPFQPTTGKPPLTPAASEAHEEQSIPTPRISATGSGSC